MKTTEDFVTFDEGFGHLADLLAGGKDSLEVTTFDNFVQDVFSQSYPDYNFNTWHIRKISAWVDELLASKNRLGMVALPRYHLKSTLCLSPDTLVKTEKGFSQIKDIKSGSLVKTHLGRYRQVLKTHKRFFEGEIIVLKLKNGETIKITNEHPVLTKQGWKKASELTLRDILMINPSCGSTTHPRKGKTNAEYYGEEHAKEISAKLSATNKRIFKGVSWDSEMYIIKPPDRVVLRTTKRKKERGDCLECGKKLKNLHTTFCGYSCRSKNRIKNGLNKNFIHKAYGEKNPMWIDGRSFLPYPITFNKILKDRIKERDGWICQLCGADKILHVHHINYTKEDLDDFNLITLCHRCNFKVNNRRSYWKDYFSARIAVMYGMVHNGMRIINISKELYSGDVYNLEIEDDNSYSGKGIIFHNCGYALSIYRFLTSFGDSLYVSYKEELATFHLSNMKQAIERNPVLNPIFRDMKTQSDSIINYRIGDKKIVRMFSSGVFSMKRGLHTDNCVVPETLIKCLGGYKKIKDIVVGDIVLTHTGTYKKVTKTMSREISESIVVLHLENEQTTRMTKEHPILTERGWVEAKNLNATDILTDTKILTISEEFYTGKVYNLEIEIDQSYCGKGIIYHNCVVVDDVLGTVDNPMVLTDLIKAERMFNQEIMNIPNPGCPLIVFGTAIDYSDLLFKLKDNPEFMHLWMPAIDPDEEHKVLWESRFNKEWLDTRKKSAGWKSFSSEFLLMPVLSADAFFTKTDLDKVIDSSLKNISIYQTFNKEDHHVVAGLDIGKRRNPSHLSVFVDDRNENLIQIHQSFWDGLEYLEQIERIKTAVENFGIDKLYIDATRSEMEERGLPRQCIMIKFTGKGERNQASYANDFAARVENKKLRLLDDDRFISQILCLTNDLRAPVTSFGHADSFWSVALALGAYQDYFSSNRKQRFSYMGNLQEQFVDHAPAAVKNLSGLCKVCNKRTLSQLPEGGWRCGNCQATFGSI